MFGLGTTVGPYPFPSSASLTEPRGGRSDHVAGLLRTAPMLSTQRAEGSSITPRDAGTLRRLDGDVAGSTLRRLDADAFSNGTKVVSEEDELRRKLSEVAQALAKRDQEIRGLKADSLASINFDESNLRDMKPGEAGDDEDIEEVLQLQEALRQNNERIVVMEGQLRRAQQGEAGSFVASGVRMPSASEALSDVSTAATAASSASTPWHDRAQALENEIRSEAAVALDVQDRIHWLRAQLRKQPSMEDERIVAINELLAQIADKVGHALPGAIGR